MLVSREEQIRNRSNLQALKLNLVVYSSFKHKATNKDLKITIHIMTLNSGIVQPNPYDDVHGSTSCATNVKPQKRCFTWPETHMTNWHHQGVCLSAAGLQRINIVICEIMFCDGVTDPVCTFDQNRNFAAGVRWQLIDQAGREWKRQDKGMMARGRYGWWGGWGRRKNLRRLSSTEGLHSQRRMP